MDEEELILIALLLAQYRKKKKCKRLYWIHPLNVNRIKESQFYITATKLRQFPERFFDYYRMSIASFDELLRLLKNKLQKEDTHMRKAISAEERLTISLRSIKFGMARAKMTLARVGPTTNVVCQEILAPAIPNNPEHHRPVEAAHDHVILLAHLGMDNFEEIPGFRGATRWYQRGGHFFVVFRSSGLSTYLRCHTHRCPVAWVLRAGQPGPIQGEHDHEPTPWVRNRNNLFQALKRRASSEATPLSAIYEEEAARYPDTVPYLLYESVVSLMHTWRRSVVPPVPRTLEALRILNTMVPNPGSSSTYLRSTDGLPAIKPEVPADIYNNQFLINLHKM